MAKMWAGRAAGQLDQAADDFNSSLRFDSRMYRQDIMGSLAHAAMLAKCGILSPAERDQLTEGLMGVLEVEKFRQLKERNQKATEQFYRKVGMGHGTQAGS